MINTLATHAWRVSDKDHIEKELDHLKAALMNNGYREGEIDRVIQKVKINKTKVKNEDTALPRSTLPYIHGTTNKIVNILKKKNICVAFSPPNSLRNMLDKVKDPINPKKQKGFYTTP